MVSPCQLLGLCSEFLCQRQHSQLWPQQQWAELAAGWMCSVDGCEAEAGLPESRTESIQENQGFPHSVLWFLSRAHLFSFFFSPSIQNYSHVDVSVKLDGVAEYNSVMSGRCIWSVRRHAHIDCCLADKIRKGEGEPVFTTCDNPSTELLAAACIWSPGRSMVPHQHGW